MSEGRDGMGSLAQAGLAALLDDGTAAGRWALDPAGSRVEFHVRHFWGAVTVHGSFSKISGEGNVSQDGKVTGRVSMDAAALGTKNKKRDEHLRSADFFDVEHHPHVVVTVTGAKPAGPASLACQGTLEAAGHIQPVEFTAHVEEASAESAVLRAELVVDRTGFAMTWSPLGMASAMARDCRRPVRTSMTVAAKPSQAVVPAAMSRAGGRRSRGCHRPAARSVSSFPPVPARTEKHHGNQSRSLDQRLAALPRLAACRG